MLQPRFKPVLSGYELEMLATTQRNAVSKKDLAVEGLVIYNILLVAVHWLLHDRIG